MEETKKEHHFFRTLFFILILLIALLIVYGKFLGNRGLIINEHQLSSKDIPKSFNNLKIAHFSDILYRGSNDEVFDELIDKINTKKVDIIIFSGNLVDKKYKLNDKKIEFLIEKLSKLNSKYGKYYVTGIDDKENASYDHIMQNSGFSSLNDSKEIIYSALNENILLAGLDYNTSNEFLAEAIKDYNSYKILVFNESDEVDEVKDYNFNLLLSSNSLNGHINIPFIKEFFLREGSKKYYNSYYKINNSDYYISNGIGTDIIDFRLFNKPSINLYILKNM